MGRSNTCNFCGISNGVVISQYVWFLQMKIPGLSNTLVLEFEIKTSWDEDKSPVYQHGSTCLDSKVYS